MDSASVLRSVILADSRRTLGPSPAPATTVNDAEAAAPNGRHADLRMLVEEDRARGHAEGMKQGLAEAEQRIRDAIGAHEHRLTEQFEAAQVKRGEEAMQRLAVLDGVMQAFLRAHETQRREMEDDAVALALTALTKVLGAETGREQVLAGLVQQGLSHLQSAGHRIRLHPMDLQLLASGADGRDLLARHPSLQWIADPSLERGSCHIDADRGTLDVGLTSQLARIRDIWSRDGAGP